MWEFAKANPGTMLLMFLIACMAIDSIVGNICSQRRK